MERRSGKPFFGYFFPLLCGVVFLLYWKQLFWDNMVPCDGSTLRLVYPSWIITRDLLSHFQSLLWDSHRNMGQPLLASPPAQVLYPLQWISPFVNFISYTKIYIACHTALILVYGYKLFVHFYRNEQTAWLGAMALAFNGLVINKASVYCDFAAMSWIPACLYYLSRGQSVRLGFCVALQWLAGLPTYSILTGVTMASLALIQENRSQQLRVLMVGTLLGAALSAIQWMPFFEYLHESQRGLFLTPEMATQYSLHPFELLRGLTIPSIFMRWFSSVSDSDPAVIGFFIGPCLFALFLWGVCRLPRFEKRLAVFSLCAFALSLGNSIRIYAHIPFITVFRFPALWLVPATVGMIWVAVAAFNSLRSNIIKRIIFAAVLVDLFAYSLTPLIGYADATFLTSTTLRPQGLQSIPPGTRLFHTENITNTVHRWRIMTMNDWYVFKGILVPSIGVAYGMDEVASQSQLTTRRHINFLIRLNQAPTESPLFSEARVSKIITLTPDGVAKPMPEQKDIRVIDNANWKPKIFMEPDYAVDIRHLEPGTLECKARGPGRVVASESFFPGWQATCDGRIIPVQLFDETFLSVEIPAGEHVVRFQYHPASFYRGLSITMLTLLLMGVTVGLKKDF